MLYCSQKTLLLQNKLTRRQQVLITIVDVFKLIASTPISELRIKNPEVTVLDPSELSKEFGEDYMDTLQLEFKGYCAWTIANCAGLLQQGDRAIGIVCFRDLFYTFSSSHALAEFCEKPEKHVLVFICFN